MKAFDIRGSVSGASAAFDQRTAFFRYHRASPIELISEELAFDETVMIRDAFLIAVEFMEVYGTEASLKSAVWDSSCST